MPSLNFILPHWLYWGTLVVFPLVAMYMVKRQRARGAPRGASIFIAYMFWVCAGMMGLHRFYLRSLWGFAYIPLFLLIIHAADNIRDHREDVSRTRAAEVAAQIDVERAKISPGVDVTPEMTERLKKAEAAEAKAKADFNEQQAELDRWYGYSRYMAILLAAMLLADAFLIPGLVRNINAREAREPAAPETAVPEVAPIGTAEDPTMHMHTRFTDAIDKLNTRVGEFVAYWGVIAVFAYYYEVIARYVFNSPTNWVHESMFLMFGMSYMFSGAYGYHADQHVRVDVFYTKWSPRGKAIADIITSVFFFIFICTMTYTGWIFAWSAYNPGSFGERSFTEWAVQYWPVKMTIPIGAGLLLLQGISKLIKDIIIVTRRA
jgi:TRAP-type mannitol/chloroaromatic compound transport system permease small subunit/heme exporter protein D